MRLTLCFVGVLALLPQAEALAQREFGGGRGRRFFGGDPNEFYVPPDWKKNVPYDGRFTFARIKYRGYSHFSNEGPGWSHDYPRAESHFTRILREITTLRPFVETEDVIGGNILALDDPDLFKFPVAYLSEPGGWFPTDSEVAGLRKYLTKGGFIIFDDFDGGGMNRDYQHFVEVMQRVLPTAQIMDVPETHSIFDSFFKVDLRLMDRGGGFNYGRARYLGIFRDNDPRKRIMAIINLNQDIGEYWQWSDQGFSPVPSNEAYKLGVNYIIYALTH